MTDFNALLAGVLGRAPPAGLPADMARTLSRYEITTFARVAHFIGQVCEETGGFTAYVENLNYSADGLMRTWPSHFPTAEFAAAYAHQPEKIANRAYASRMGNGDEASGDGWKYRGRGDDQTTGRDAYVEARRETGLDLVNHPELLAGFGGASLIAAAAFWKLHGCNELADAGDIVAITKRVNGGLNGFARRKMYTARAMAVLLGQGGAPAVVEPAPVIPAPEPAQAVPAPPPASVAPPEPAAPPALATSPDLAPPDLDIPPLWQNLATMARDRIGAWSGGIAGGVGAAVAFLHRLTAGEIMVIVALALLSVLALLVALYWGSRKEHHHDAIVQQALATPAPGQPPGPALAESDIARIAEAVASLALTPSAAQAA